MPSVDEKVAIIRDAIRTAKQLHFSRGGHRRETCCHVLGTTKGAWRGLFWQFGGTSSQGAHDLPEWRYFDLDEISDLIAVEGEWHRGETTGTRRQRGIEVEIEIVPEERAALPTRIAKPRIQSHAPQRRTPRTRW